MFNSLRDNHLKRSIQVVTNLCLLENNIVRMNIYTNMDYDFL